MVEDEKMTFLKSRPQKERSFLGIELNEEKKEAASILGETAKKQISNQEYHNTLLSVNGEGEFPIDIFPKVIIDFIEEVALSLQCPKDFVAVALLVCAGTAIGTSKELEVKEGWRESPRIYCAIVAEPGSKKTPALNKALSVMYEIQEEMIKKYNEELEVYKDEEMLYEVEVESWRKQAKKTEGKLAMLPQQPKQPTAKQLITSDATWEALTDLMENNPKGILFHKDELSGWVKGMDQYRAKGADRQNWLSVWSGENITVNRKGRRTNITRPLVNVLGGIQPDVLDDLIDRGREDGFVDRMLFSYPHHSPSYWNESGISNLIMNQYKEIIRSLFNEQSKVVKLDSEAKDIFKKWYNDMQSEINHPAFPVTLKGAWSKFISYCIRLTLIVYSLRYVCNETNSEDVDAISMHSTIKLTNYFKAHTQKVYSILKTDENTRKIYRAVNYIREKSKKGEIKLRDFQKSNVCGVRTSNETLKLFRQMEHYGFGVVEDRKNMSGRTSTYFKLN